MRLHRIAAALALLAGLCFPALAAACAPGKPGLEGLYVLEGEMEVGAQLMLLADGRFEFGLAYGAIDQYGRGCWSVDGTELTLKVKGRKVPARHSPEDRRFRGMTLIVERDGLLRWPLPGFRGMFERVRR